MILQVWSLDQQNHPETYQKKMHILGPHLKLTESEILEMEFRNLF